MSKDNPQPLMMVMNGRDFVESVYLTLGLDTPEYRVELARDAADSNVNFEDKYSQRIALIRELLKARHPNLDVDDDFLLSLSPRRDGVATSAVMLDSPIVETPLVESVAVTAPATLPLATSYAQSFGASVTPRIAILSTDGQVSQHRDIGLSQLLSRDARNDLRALRIRDESDRREFVYYYHAEIAYELSKMGDVPIGEIYILFHPYGETDRFKLIEHERFRDGATMVVIPSEEESRQLHLSQYSGVTIDNNLGVMEAAYKTEMALIKATAWHKDIDFAGKGLAAKLAERPVVIFQHDGRIGHRKLGPVLERDGVVDNMLSDVQKGKMTVSEFVTKYIDAVCRTLVKLKKDFPDVDLKSVLICLEPNMERSVAVHERMSTKYKSGPRITSIVETGNDLPADLLAK